MRTRFIYFPPEILIPNLGEEIDHNRFLDQVLKKVRIDGMKSSIKKKTSRKLGGEEILRGKIGIRIFNNAILSIGGYGGRGTIPNFPVFAGWWETLAIR